MIRPSSGGVDDVTAVAQLVLHERRARDRGWWDVMAQCLAPDAAIRLSWFRGSGADFVAASQAMAGRGDKATHVLSPPIVDVVGDRAVAEIGAAIHMRGDLGGFEVDLTSHARLLYRAERRAGKWVLVSLDPVYEYDRLESSVPGLALRVEDLGRATLARARPSYRMLTCLLGATGYTVADDLYGDDRPDPVRQLYRTLFAWLHSECDGSADATAAKGDQSGDRGARCPPSEMSGPELSAPLMYAPKFCP